MRICERCHCEMISEGIGAGSECEYGSGAPYIIIKSVNERRRGPNSTVKKGSLLDKYLDMKDTSNISLYCSVAICPNCGRVEQYLDKQ